MLILIILRVYQFIKLAAEAYIYFIICKLLQFSSAHISAVVLTSQQQQILWPDLHLRHSPLVDSTK